MFSILAIVGGLLLLIIAQFLVRIYLNASKIKIPGITIILPPLPILRAFRTSIFSDFQKVYYKLGEAVDESGVSVENTNTNKKDIMRLTMWWARNFVVVQNANLVKQIFVKKAKSYPKPENLYDSFSIYGRNILSANGEEWRRHRTLCNPAFSDEHLRHLCDVSVDSVNQLTARYETAMKKQNNLNQVNVDVFQDMTLITFDIIGKAGFGYDMKIWQGKQDEFDASKHTMSFKTALDVATESILYMRARYWRWVTKLPIPYFQLAHRGIKEAEQYIREIVASRKRGGEQQQQQQQYDLLSLLTSSKDGELGFLSSDEILSDSFIFLVAGHETTSTQLSWTLYRLAKHQDIQEKLRREVDAVLQGRDPCYEDYKTLRYLNCVVKESLRMHPPVARVFKKADEDDVVGKYKIPAGSSVMVNVYSIHHDERYWDAPWEFNPDRFDAQLNPQSFNTFAFIPFSIGNRNCIGQHFSLMESCMILAKLVQKFTVEFLPGTPEDYKPDTVSLITVRPKDMHLLLKKRVN